MAKPVFHNTMRLAILILLTLSCAASASLQRKPFVLNTVLVDNGRPNAVIVASDAALASKVQSAVKSASGAALPIGKDSDYAGVMGELKHVPAQNVILIGNQETSWFVTYLCHVLYCGVDTQYPGRGGYIIKSIHDPWGTGVNVILITGSDKSGIAAGVDRFCSLLPSAISHQPLTIPRTFDAHFSAEAVKANPKLVTDLSDAEIAKQVEKASDDYRAGIQGGTFNPICYAATAYAQSGRECYAKLFRALVLKVGDLAKNESQGSFGGPWGAAADFLFGPFITGWDSIEESPSLTDADRAQITQIILDFIHYVEEHGYSRNLDKPSLRQNHFTFDGQGWLAAGQYFGKYYDTPESAKWMQMADWCFGYQMKSFKPQEDCGAYQWIITRHMCRYAVSRQDFGWFTSGKSRMSGDLGIMETDNLGYPSSNGDVAGFAPLSVQAPWSTMFSVERDGRWVWALEKTRKAQGLSGPGALAANVAPVEPTDLLGVKCMPTDPLFYDFYKANQTVPQEKTYEKITFRRSFDPKDAYLLLDGISGCYHGHWDGNSILRMTDRGRIWLCDSDYIKSLPKYHNTMLIFRNGQSSTLPIFCEKQLSADLAQTGMSRTTTHDYAGADWTRNIIWGKGHAFVFIDELQAQNTADYSFRAYWQTLGVPSLDGNLFRVTQKGPSFSIRNLDGARLRHFDDPVIGQNWNGYRYAEADVRTLQQIRTQKLRAGGKVFIMNVLSTEAGGESPVEAQRAGESSILLGNGDDQSLIGVRSGSDEIVPGLKTDAEVYRLSRKSIALGNATRVEFHGQSLLQSDLPVSVEFSGGKAVVVTDSDAKVTIGGVTTDLKPGRHELTGLRMPKEFAFEMPKPTPAYGMASSASQSGAKPLSPALQEKGSFSALASGDTGIYAGSTGGKLLALTPDGKTRWTFDAGSRVRAVWVGKLDKDAPPVIAVGTSGAAVYLLDQSGKQLWKHDIPFFKVPGPVVTITSGDLSGDGNHELIVGSENWHYYALDSKGNEFKSYEILHSATAGTAADLDGDGKQEIIAGSEYYSWRAFKPTGETIWDYRPIGPRNNSALVGDVTGSGKPTVLFGGADGNVHALDGAGKRKWLYNTGDEVTGMALMDVNGDGVQDIIAGTLGFDVVALKGDGTPVWRRDLGEPVLTLVLADLNGDGKKEICAGTEDGHVFVLDQSGRVIANRATSGAVTSLTVVPGSPERLAVESNGGGLVVLRME